MTKFREKHWHALWKKEEPRLKYELGEKWWGSRLPVCEVWMDLREIYWKMIFSLGDLDTNENHYILLSPRPMHFGHIYTYFIIHKSVIYWTTVTPLSNY